MEKLKHMMEQWFIEDKEIKKMKGNGEKIFALLQKHSKLLSMCFLSLNIVLNQKNEDKALEFKLKGNKEFTEQKYLEAIKSYNESLCYSKTDSTNISIIFANRSAVYLKLGYYETSLKNIQLALEHGYPENLKPKLLKRREDCLKLVNNEGGNRRHEDTESEIKLSYIANQKIPFMVDGIELVEHEKYGRGLVATRDFKAGDILINEEPFVKTVESKTFYTHCFWCVKSNLMSLLPCDESVMAMFCSKKCYEKNLKNGLEKETKALNIFNNLFPDQVAILRSVVKVLTTFKDVDDLKKLLDACDLQKTTAFDIDYANTDTVEGEKLQAFFNLASNWKHRSDVDHMNYLRLSAMVYFIIVECTNLKENIVTDEQKITVMNMIHRICEIKSANAFGFLSATPNYNNTMNDTSIIDPGSAICLLTSLANHSCAPNLFGFGDNVKAFIAHRPIKVGEQLFVGYRPSHTASPLAERKMQLKRDYFFDCSCVACEKNYPLMRELPTATVIPRTIIPKVMALLEKIDFLSITDMKKVEKAFKICNDLIQKYDHFYPCYELEGALFNQIRCTIFLFSNIPLQPLLNR